MLKRILYGSGAAGAATAAYFVGSLTLGGAFAQTSPTASPTARPAAPASQPAAPAAPAVQPAAPASKPAEAKETGGQADTANEAAESAALAAQAKITVDQAKAAALAKFPGATIGKTELDSENGVVAYDIKLTDSAGKRQDLSIDATSGAVLATEAEGAGGAEGPETPGAAEGPETPGAAGTGA